MIDRANAGRRRAHHVRRDDEGGRRELALGTQDGEHALLIGFAIFPLHPVEGRHLEPAFGGGVARSDDAVLGVKSHGRVPARRQCRQRRTRHVVRERIDLVPAAGLNPREARRVELDHLVHPLHHAHELDRFRAREPGDVGRAMAGGDRRQKARRAQHVADRVELDEDNAVAEFRCVPARGTLGAFGLVEGAWARGTEEAARVVDYSPNGQGLKAHPFPPFARERQWHASEAPENLPRQGPDCNTKSRADWRGLGAQEIAINAHHRRRIVSLQRALAIGP